MKHKFILFLLGLSFVNTTIANEEFNFVNDYVDSFSKLNIAAMNFQNSLNIETDVQALKTAVINYNNDLKNSLDQFSKHINSENLLLQKIASDLNHILSDLIKHNEKHLKFLNKSKLSSKKITKRNQSLLFDNEMTSSNLNTNAIGIRMLLLLPSSDENSDKFFCALTIEQRNSLNLKFYMALSHNNNPCNGFECVCNSDFEHALRLIYVFVNQPGWEFKQE